MRSWVAFVSACGVVIMLGCGMGGKNVAPAETSMEAPSTKTKEAMEAPSKAKEAPMEKQTTSTVNLSVEGMMCNNCANAVAAALKGASGVTSATVDLATKSASVMYDAAKISPDQIAAVVNHTKNLHDANKTYMASVKK